MIWKELFGCLLHIEMKRFDGVVSLSNRNASFRFVLLRRHLYPFSVDLINAGSDYLHANEASASLNPILYGDMSIILTLTLKDQDFEIERGHLPLYPLVYDSVSLSQTPVAKSNKR
jgi:hypothetical protein